MNEMGKIADAFIDARMRGGTLATFPGTIPVDLTSAYMVQDLEIRRREDELAGWKIATIRPEFRDRYPAARLAGPIFKVARTTRGEMVEMTVIENGFAAVEAEFAFKIGRDLPFEGAPYDVETLIASVQSLHIAVEIAGSPLSCLSDLGPGAVISDHGNNAGLVIGEAISDWSERAEESLVSRMSINGKVVGEGAAATVPGGLIGALSFLVENLASRGRLLKAGDWVSTGATTGVHRVQPGATALADFGAFGSILVRIVPARGLV